MTTEGSPTMTIPEPLTADHIREAQLEQFMGWLFRDGGLEPPRREYDAVEQRLRLLVNPLDGEPHVHDPEQCAGCRAQADLFFGGGVKAEAVRAATPTPAEPGLREALERTVRQLHAVSVASGRASHRRGSHLHCHNRTCVEALSVLAATPDTLDVERLAQANVNAQDGEQDPPLWTLMGEAGRDVARAFAERVAAEYARLREDRS